MRLQHNHVQHDHTQCRPHSGRIPLHKSPRLFMLATSSALRGQSHLLEPMIHVSQRYFLEPWLMADQVSCSAALRHHLQSPSTRHRPRLVQSSTTQQCHCRSAPSTVVRAIHGQPLRPVNHPPDSRTRMCQIDETKRLFLNSRRYDTLSRHHGLRLYLFAWEFSS